MFFKIINYQNTIIARYLLRNLLTFFIVIAFIIGLIVLGNQFVLTAQESIEYGIPLKELIPLVGFNMLRDIPVILSISLFIAIIVCISQLYKNSEAVVMNTMGIGDKKFMSLIQPAVVFTFIVITFLTLYGVPWAKQQKNITENTTVNASEFSFITSGKFESFKDGDIVFYASDSQNINDLGDQNLEEVFIYASNDGNSVAVLAADAKKYIDPVSKSTYLRLRNGTRYEGLSSNTNINILNFESYDLEIVSGEVKKSIADLSEIEEKNTIDLIKEGGPLAIAELQWRISQPISILILSVLGVLLGKSSPRGGKGVNLLIGIVVFLLYINGLLVAKSSIENGELNPIIGLWSVHLLLILFLIIFYQFREGNFTYFVDKIAFFNIKEKKSHV